MAAVEEWAQRAAEQAAVGEGAVRRRLLRSRGYTLLEVLFAVAVLGFGMLGIYALQSVAAASNRNASKMTAARMLAQQELEYLMGLSFSPNGSLPSDLSITNADITTASSPYAYFAHPTGTAGTQPTAITALGTTSSTDGVRSFYRTWDVSYPIVGDTTVVEIKVRVTFFDTRNGRPHGVTVSTLKYQDPE